MKNLSSTWQKVIVWVTGYLNIIAFILTGGYFYKNTEDESVRYSAKTAFVITVIFAVISALQSLVSAILNLAEVNNAYLAMNKISYTVTVLKIVSFTVFCILDLCGIRFMKKTEEKKEPAKEEPKEEETPEIAE